MSSSSSAALPCSASTSASTGSTSGCSRTPSACPAAKATTEASRSGASGTQVDAVWKRLGHFGSRLQRQPRLARAARPAERQQPHLVATQQLNDACQLFGATQKRRRRNRQVRPIQALQRRELTLPQLVHTLRRSQILETVLPEVAKLRADRQRSRRRRHKHLTPVTGCRDPRRTVYVDAHVPLVGQKRRSRVHSHPNADRTLDKRRLPRGSRLEPVRRRLEHEEERVALGIHLHAADGRQRLAEHATVLRERHGVPVGAELVEQPGRTLDVREDEGDGAGRKVLSHAP